MRSGRPGSMGRLKVSIPAPPHKVGPWSDPCHGAGGSRSVYGACPGIQGLGATPLSNQLADAAARLPSAPGGRGGRAGAPASRAVLRGSFATRVRGGLAGCLSVCQRL